MDSVRNLEECMLEEGARLGLTDGTWMKFGCIMLIFDTDVSFDIMVAMFISIFHCIFWCACVGSLIVGT